LFIDCKLVFKTHRKNSGADGVIILIKHMQFFVDHSRTVSL